MGDCHKGGLLFSETGLIQYSVFFSFSPGDEENSGRTFFRLKFLDPCCFSACQGGDLTSHHGMQNNKCLMYCFRYTAFLLAKDVKCAELLLKYGCNKEAGDG